MKKCPICGEQYADTYRSCPFCEEDERASRRRQRYVSIGGRRPRGSHEESASGVSGGHRAAPPPQRGNEYDDHDERRGVYREDDHRDGYDDYDDYDDRAYDDDRGRSGDLWFKIIMGILIAIILACLLYLGRGVIGNMLGGIGPADIPSSSLEDGDPDDGTEPGTDRYDPTKPNIPDSPDTPNTGTDSDTTEPDTTTDPDTTDPGTTTTPNTTTPGTTTPGTTTSPNTPTTTANAKDVLSHYDVTIDIGGTFNLKPKGVTTAPSYTSADSSIATVDSSGKVTGVKKGTTKVTVTWDGTKAECIVRVKGSTAAPEGDGNNGGTPAQTSLKLNREDFTMDVGETVTLKATGGASEVTWSIGDSSVATVDGSGKVTGVKKGMTTVTATSGGQTAKCIVRVR